MISRLHDKFRKEAIPALSKRFGFTNTMAVPHVKKVTVNIGLGEASANVKLLDTAAAELGQITGQKAVITRAKKSIANFKIRKGMPIGCMVTLRGERMYEFLDRLSAIVLPRVRDFKGLAAQFLRRPRQLYAGLERPVGVSRNRLHASGQNQGHEHHDYHHSPQRRRRTRAAETARRTFPGVKG